MNLKKLTQAVFEGLPSEYRFAIVGKGGVAAAHTKDPFALVDENRWNTAQGSLSMLIGYGFDDSDWQNSKIERQDVPTADIDWSRQDVPEGATYYRPKGSLFYKNDRGLRYWSEARERWIESGEPDLLTSRISELVEIRKPEPKIDWSAAPKGATHYTGKYRQYYKQAGHAVMLWDVDAWVKLVGFTTTDLDNMGAIKRPESITDVARSIEAARTEEQACMPWPDGDPRYFETSDVPETKKHPHYFKDVSDVDAIDLYHVARLYEITDPALFHAFKKIACAGKRGAKDQAQDVQEAIDALQRWQELNV